ncbi:MAG: DUF6809 family protein [Christensenellales bacterium]
MNIIEELYYGNINPIEKEFKRDSSYAKFMKIFSENEHKLYSFFEEHKEEKELFTAMCSALLDFGERERFIEGFRLGARFLLDMLITERPAVVQDIT